ncbi:uncharacterized protein LOC116263666 [Nymphaea colorata]|nr:uncharacterized protein LOC116263666 [Nymphaea colorata]
MQLSCLYKQKKGNRKKYSPRRRKPSSGPLLRFPNRVDEANLSNARTQLPETAFLFLFPRLFSAEITISFLSATEGCPRDSGLSASPPAFVISSLVSYELCMHKEMERESAINALVELVQQARMGCLGQQMQAELEDMRIVLAETIAVLEEKDKELARIKERQEQENRDYEKLHRKYAALQEMYAQEEARRLAAVQSYEDETRRRLTMEKEISTLVNKYERASEQVVTLHERIWDLEHENNFMKESIDRLHGNVSFLEQEKNYWWHDAGFARRHAATLQQQLDASYASLRVKDQEIKSLREDIEDIHQMQEIYVDTHQQPVLVQKFTDELHKCKKSMENLSLAIEDFKADKNVISQAEQLEELQHQLHSIQLDLQVAEDESLAMKQTNEEQKKEIEVLKDRLADVSIELFESILLQKKFQSTIKRLQAKE